MRTSTRKEIEAKRLRWAMRPINLHGMLVIPETFIWRIVTIVGVGEWKPEGLSVLDYDAIWARVWSLGLEKLVDIDLGIRKGKWRIHG